MNSLSETHSILPTPLHPHPPLPSPQGMWEKDSALLQLPHFTKELTSKFAEKGVETVADLVEMDDDERAATLAMNEEQLADVARVCNRFPSIDLSYELVNGEDVAPGESVTLQVRTACFPSLV